MWARVDRSRCQGPSAVLVASIVVRWRARCHAKPLRGVPIADQRTRTVRENDISEQWPHRMTFRDRLLGVRRGRRTLPVLRTPATRRPVAAGGRVEIWDSAPRFYSLFVFPFYVFFRFPFVPSWQTTRLTGHPADHVSDTDFFIVWGVSIVPRKPDMSQYVLQQIILRKKMKSVVWHLYGFCGYGMCPRFDKQNDRFSRSLRWCRNRKALARNRVVQNATRNGPATTDRLHRVTGVGLDSAPPLPLADADEDGRFSLGGANQFGLIGKVVSRRHGALRRVLRRLRRSRLR